VICKHANITSLREYGGEFSEILDSDGGKCKSKHWRFLCDVMYSDANLPTSVLYSRNRHQILPKVSQFLLGLTGSQPEGSNF
jgi:hypothetical protein